MLIISNGEQAIATPDNSAFEEDESFASRRHSQWDDEEEEDF
jgi:hypothetical protein